MFLEIQYLQPVLIIQYDRNIPKHHIATLFQFTIHIQIRRKCNVKILNLHFTRIQEKREYDEGNY